MKNIFVLLSLSTCLTNGKGSMKPLPPYFEQYRARIEAGDGVLLFELMTDQYLHTGCRVPFDQDVDKLLRKMIEKDGNPRAMAYLGQRLLWMWGSEEERKKNHIEGLGWLKMAIQKKDYKALEHVAMLYSSGKYPDFFPQDRKMAEKLLVQSMEARVELAKNGDAQAMFDIYFIMDYTRWPLANDFMKSLNPNPCVWLERAAEKKHLGAVYWYSDRLMAIGRGKKDKVMLARGIKMQQQALENGYLPGMRHMAIQYLTGNSSCPKNPAKAWYWIDRYIAYTGCDSIIRDSEAELMNDKKLVRPKPAKVK